jgi:Arc/MetJ-type ribon-helix-helix transcriptional regulator/predicted transcriptional regulator
MASSRLVLNTAGIKSPLDVGDTADPPGSLSHREPESTAGASAPAPRRVARQRPTVPAPSPRPSRPRPSSDKTPFYGTGRPRQTSIALDPEHASQLDALARVAGVSLNALAVAALHAGVPPAPEDARAAIIDERVERAGGRAARVEHNLRLPEHLRARIDELTSAARARHPRATRSDLINAALRRGLPTDAEAAAKLVADHARRIERQAA